MLRGGVTVEVVAVAAVAIDGAEVHPYNCRRVTM